LSAFLAIAANTLREALRDRILYLVLFFAALVILGSEALAVLAVGAHEKVVLDLGLAAIAFFGALASVFLGLSQVAREIDRRTVYTIVSKPISRAAFVAGKMAGLYATVVLLVAAMGALFLAFVRLRLGAAGADLLKPIGLSLVEDLVLASFAVLFSSFTTPILGTLFTITVYVIGHLSYGLKMLAAFPALAGSFTAKALVALYYLLPNLERFNVRGAAVHDLPVGPVYVAAATAYGVAYALAVLALATAVFARRDLV
jgi:ABC-type transport system involved in multi-copper enzyme maturation permease subunit